MSVACPPIIPKMPTDIERRQVAYDAATGTLTVGGRTAVVTSALGDNEQLLRTYLGLVAQQREVDLGRAVHLRRIDIATLAEMLDLDDADLEGQLQRILSLSDEQAADLHRRLLRQRFAAVAIGVGIFAGASANLVPAGAAEAGTPKQPAAVSQMTQLPSSKAIGSAVTVAAPVESEPAPAPAAESEPEVEVDYAVRYERGPAPADGVDIGDALFIER
jgi:hypothetical protein